MPDSNVVRRLVLCAALVMAPAAAADFGTRGGPEPANIDALVETLRNDPYDLELFISFGTSKGGSAGHLALGVRDQVPGDDLVYSANFYADRSNEHATGFYTDDLMAMIPKKEYLFRTTSSLGESASFGLDFGEIYKRSVIGIRVYGVPASEKQSVVAYFRRINDDYHRRAKDTEYHDGEIKYDYLRLNCAKTIGAAFRHGAGYSELEVTAPRILAGRRVVAAANANIPTEMALRLLREWNARGYGLDVVLYRKSPNSTYVDPHEEDKVMFKDLPDRFPSVLSRDFRREQGQYEDPDNLYAMYLLYNLGRYGIRIDDQTRRLVLSERRTPLPYAEAARLAAEAAEVDSDRYGRASEFVPMGTRVWEDVPVRTSRP
ncbi:MAG TPA: hypothetical protein VFN64_09120 [Burkholderiaceae bacterium]|nr:hypothetical protein [Burkholderiaceae bacterium]